MEQLLNELDKYYNELFINCVENAGINQRADRILNAVYCLKPIYDNYYNSLDNNPEIIENIKGYLSDYDSFRIVKLHFCIEYFKNISIHDTNTFIQNVKNSILNDIDEFPVDYSYKITNKLNRGFIITPNTINRCGINNRILLLLIEKYNNLIRQKALIIQSRVVNRRHIQYFDCE